MRKTVCVLLAATLGFGGFMCGCKRREGQKERTVYEVTAEYMPAERSLIGTVKVDFYNSSALELDSVCFQLYPNAYRKGAVYSPVGYDVWSEAYYAGESYGDITVSSVVGGVNYEIAGADKNILAVRLANPIPPEGRVTLDVGFCTRVPTVKQGLGVTPKTVNLVGAFPTVCALTYEGFYECLASDIADVAFAECADYEMRLTVPKEYSLLATGEMREENWLESKKRYTVFATNVRELAFVLSSEWTAGEERTGKTAVKYYALGGDDSAETARLATEAVAFYSATFGEYFADTISVAETDIVRGVGSYAGVCLATRELSIEENRWAVAYAIALQWWRAAVGVNRSENGWLADGLAEYSAMLFFDKHAEYGRTKKDCLQVAGERYREYVEQYQKALGWVDTRMNRPLSSFLNVYEYERVSLDRTALMFTDLEKAIGQKKVLAGLRKYYAECLGGMATPAHLVGAFERIGLELQGFFEGYWAGKETFAPLTKKS